jgi:hypothetical protein
MSLILLLLVVGHVVGESSSQSMMLNIEADKSFLPSNLSTLVSQSLVLTSVKCVQLCLMSSNCQVATYNTSDSSCSIYNVNVSAGSLLSSFSHTTYLVISVFPPHITGKRRRIFYLYIFNHSLLGYPQFTKNQRSIEHERLKTTCHFNCNAKKLKYHP